MREPTYIGAVVIATCLDRPQWGAVSFTRIGSAEPEDSTEPDYTPWVRTENIESGSYFHRTGPGEHCYGVGHYSWDQLDADTARLGGPIGDAIAMLNNPFMYDDPDAAIQGALQILEGDR